MSGIPLPALAVRPPEQPDMMGNMSKLMMLKNAMGQQQIQQQTVQSNALELEQKQREMKDQEAIMQAAAAHNGSLVDALPELAGKISARSFVPLQKSIMDAQKSYSEKKKLDLDNEISSGNQLLGLIQQAKALPPDQYAQAFPQIAASALKIKPELQGHIDPAKPVPQSALDQFALGVATHTQLASIEAEKRAQATTEADLKAKAAELPGQLAKSALAQQVTAGTKDGLTPQEQITTQQRKQELGIQASRFLEEKRHNQATEGSLTNDALTMAAQQYATTGVMPAVGRTAGMRSQIMNEAARAYPKIDIATNAAAYKANEDSLKKLQSQRDSVSAFENTALKNLDLFLSTAKSVVDTGSPWLNTPLRAINQKMIGDKDQAAYNVARQVAVNEIAKVTSNPGLTGALSDSARGEVSNFNPDNATLAQTYKVAEVLKKDMANRGDAYDQQIADIKRRIGGGSTAATKTYQGHTYTQQSDGSWKLQ